MLWTVKEALKDNAIDKVVMTKDGFSFWLKGIQTRISVVLSLDQTRGGYKFYLSHSIKIPGMVCPYRIPSRPWKDHVAYEASLAVTAITRYYKQAVRNGYRPSSEWLVRNEKEQNSRPLMRKALRNR